MSPPPQDVLAFDGLLGNTNYEAVPAGMADDVVQRYRRRARKWVLYRILGVVVVGIIAGAVLLRFVESVAVAAGVAAVFVLVGSAFQLRARNQGVPEVVARDVSPGEVRAEYGVDPTEHEEILAEESE